MIPLEVLVSESDILSLTDRLDTIIDILIFVVIVCGMLLGSSVFLHFRK